MAKVRDAVHARGRLMAEDVESGINMVQWLPDLLKQWLADAKAKH